MGKLTAKKQGAPDGAHLKSILDKTSGLSSQTSEPSDWKGPTIQGGSRDSSIVSLDDHSLYTTAQLIQWDNPSWDHSASSSGNDIIPIHDLLFDEDMDIDNDQLEWRDHPAQHTEDSSPDSGLELDNHPSSGSGHNSDSDSDHRLHPGSNLGSRPSSDSKSESSSSSSDDQAGDFSDLFNIKLGGSAPTPKNLESRGQSSSYSWSWKADGHKWPHTPFPQNQHNPDKLEQKKEKSDPSYKETPSKGHFKSKSDQSRESLEDKLAWEFGKDIVCQFWEEEEKQKRKSQSKKVKEMEETDAKAEDTAEARAAHEKEEHHKKKKKKKDAKEKEAPWCESPGWWRKKGGWKRVPTHGQTKTGHYRAEWKIWNGMSGTHSLPEEVCHRIAVAITEFGWPQHLPEQHMGRLVFIPSW